MFFVAAKILGFFALPSNIQISLGLVGIVLMATRFARAGRRLAITALILLAISGLSPLGNAIILPLEERLPGIVARAQTGSSRSAARSTWCRSHAASRAQ